MDLDKKCAFLGLHLKKNHKWCKLPHIPILFVTFSHYCRVNASFLLIFVEFLKVTFLIKLGLNIYNAKKENV